jgi:hypothetical protein
VISGIIAVRNNATGLNPAIMNFKTVPKCQSDYG